MGKTTTTLALGSTFATLRGDRVVVVDANPDAGNLAHRVAPPIPETITDLLRHLDDIQSYAELRSYVSQAPESRLEVLGSDDDPRIGLALDRDDYHRLIRLLDRFYNPILLDTGTGILDSAHQGLLTEADELVLVLRPGLDGGRAAALTLDRLDEHQYGELVTKAIVVINGVRRGLGDVDTTASATAGCDGCTATATALHIAYLDRLTDATVDNVTVAWSQCRDCSATAVSVQVVILRSPETVHADNRALAVNAACAGCPRRPAQPLRRHQPQHLSTSSRHWWAGHWVVRRRSSETRRSGLGRRRRRPSRRSMRNCHSRRGSRCSRLCRSRRRRSPRQANRSPRRRARLAGLTLRRRSGLDGSRWGKPAGMGLVQNISRQAAGYARPDRATGGYAAAMGVFGAVAGGLSLVAWRTGRRPPPLTPWELTLLGLATHKIARIVAKDAVTSPVRAPFTRFEGPQGNAELAEEVRGSGARKAVGELLTCPFCLGPWVATTLTAGLTFAPGVTRPAMGVFSAVAVSDFLQLGYAAAQQRTDPPESRGS